MEINLQELDDSIPYVELQKNKLCINESAKILLNAEAGDRISINYWTVNNQYTFPVIAKSEVFDSGLDGNKLTKSNTISYRGVQNEVLSKYGNLFIIKDLNSDEFITKNGKIYKLEPVTTDDDKEVVESEKELNDWNDSSSDLDDINLIDF